MSNLPTIEDLAARVSELEQFRDDFDQKVNQKLEPKAKRLEEEIQALRAELAQTKMALSEVIEQAKNAAAAAQTTANGGVTRANNAQTTADAAVQQAKKAQTIANDGVARAKNAQETADKVKSSVAHLIKSEVLTQFVKQVKYHMKGGYNIFKFPNLWVFDLYADGALYSRNAVKQNSGPAWPE